MIKTLLKSCIRRVVWNDVAWTLLDRSLLTVARYADFERECKERQPEFSRLGAAMKQHCSDMVVLNGPFQGMRYPEAIACGSSLFPKLLGSYELEIQSLVEDLCSNEYSEIIDVGCAEGYYAVGLALRIGGATVFAFDVNQQAIEACRKMAQANDVATRIVLSGECNADTLRTFAFKGRGLVISDCEGYEKTLFAEDVPECLSRHDVLIEVHDFVDISIGATLRDRFESTHILTVYRSVDDIEKARTYMFRELQGYDLSTKQELLAEHRPSIMEWYLFRARS